MTASNLLFKAVFKSDGSSEDVQNYMSQVVAEHPYFSIGQFYLLQQMPSRSAGYNLQASKTAILFNNPHWLQFQLQESNTNDFDSAQEGIPNITTAAEEINQHFPDDQQAQVAFAAASFNDQLGPAVKELQHEDQAMNVEERRKPIAESFNEKDIYYNQEQETPGRIIEVEDFHEPHHKPSHSDTIDELPNQPGKEEETQVVENDLSNTELIHTGHSEVTGNESAMHGSIENGTKGKQQYEPANIETVENSYQEADEDLLAPDDENSTGNQEPLNFKLDLTPPSTTEENISFEPLHTTDYFASQGIKLSAEVKPNDKLGKQLKSFTEWLKTMKKVHTDQMIEPDTQTHVNIQQLAERSNTEDEVVTEAMAEVLVQQGKNTKAREVYKKLSLLNPSKSAYFAAKIDHLKDG